MLSQLKVENVVKNRISHFPQRRTDVQISASSFLLVRISNSSLYNLNSAVLMSQSIAFYRFRCKLLHFKFTVAEYLVFTVRSCKKDSDNGY